MKGRGANCHDAVRRHQERAAHHETEAERWLARGDRARAALERHTAVIQLEAAELARQRAVLASRAA